MKGTLRASRWLLLALLILAVPAVSHAQVFVSVRVGPPPLPVYEQPLIPGPGYLWVPGYWAYGPGGYYWVPGTWVEPPEVGLLWTPGYWGWAGGLYVWHGGYWGPHVGFYGGINYGFGYTGVGYAGGYWRGREFFYNRAVTNVNGAVIHNVYDRRVAYDRAVSRAAFNGGPGGVAARPSSVELAAARERHFEATTAQTRNLHAASSNRAMFASENHGRPSVAATAHAGEFRGAGVVAARPAGAINRNAETFHSQPGAAKSSAATGERGPVRGQTGAQGAPAARTAISPNTSASTGSRQPRVNEQPHQGQPSRQVEQQQHQQPQQRQAQEQKQQHEGQQHQGEQHEGKPHKPRG